MAVVPENASRTGGTCLRRRLSLLVAALVLTMRGASINAMTVAGLAMAVGAVVDDAVSDLDTIARRLRRHRSGGETTPAAAVVLQATLTMRRSMLFAALIGVLAVLPLLSLSGVTGSFARPLVVSYALAVAASMLVALILLPALALTLLPSARTGRRPLPRRLHRWYDRGVAPYLFRPLWAFAAVGVLALSGLAVTPFLHGAALPALQDRSLLVHWQAAPGTSLPEMDRITEAAGRQLRAVPGVATVGAHVGRALTSDQVSDVDSAELWVTARSSSTRSRKRCRELRPHAQRGPPRGRQLSRHPPPGAHLPPRPGPGGGERHSGRPCGPGLRRRPVDAASEGE